MSLLQLARGLWTGWKPSENPFSTPNGMEENLRLIDDHLALYTLAPPLPVGSDLPQDAVDGDGQLKNEVTATTPVVVDFGAKLRNTMIDNLGDLAATAVTDFKNLRSAVASVLKGIAADIMRSGVKEALKSVFSTSGSSGSGGGLWGSIFSAVGSMFGAGKAEGGYIRGPGTATSDSIPAMLSNGEFVQPTRAVQHYGTGFMEAVRTLQLPKPRYAFGGLVQASQRARFATGGLVGAGAAQGTPNVSIEITNTGTPQRVVQQTSESQLRGAVIRIMLDDERNGGPYSRRPRRG
jgi:hypothetical protein